MMSDEEFVNSLKKELKQLDEESLSRRDEEIRKSTIKSLSNKQLLNQFQKNIVNGFFKYVGHNLIEPSIDKITSYYNNLSKDSYLKKMVKNLIDNKRQIKVGAAVLGLGTVLGAGYKKYQNIKITRLQLEKIKALENEKMLALETELEKYKISSARKKKIMALVLFGSIGAIILGSKAKSLKKKGGNKKKTLKN